MTNDVEITLKKVLQCTKKSGDRGYSAAYDMICLIGKSGKRKALRPAAMDALKRICLEAYKPLRSIAANQLGELMTGDDTGWLPFLRENLKNEELSYGCVCGLLNVLDVDAYPEIVKVILDEKCSLDNRSSALEEICEHSGLPFSDDLPVFQDMKPGDLPVKEIRAWAKAGFPPYVPIKIKLPVAELGKLGITLPKEYSTFLQSHRSGLSYECGDCSWDLTTAGNLLRKVNIDGKIISDIQQLRRYAATLIEVMEKENTVDDKGKSYALARLASGIAIGNDDSGDVLYLDPSNDYSVWIFHHDGGDVERVAKSFRAWLRKAKRESD